MNKKIPEKIDLDEVLSFVKQYSTATRLYLGCDSEKHKINGVWYADYITVVVVHIDGCKGGRIFGALVRERDYDHNKKKPSLRLMTEVKKVAELYLEVFDKFTVIPEIALNLEVHLDVNKYPEHASSLVMQEAIGYVRGVCGVEPKLKPDAWSASYCADRLTEIVSIPSSKNVETAKPKILLDELTGM